MSQPLMELLIKTLISHLKVANIQGVNERFKKCYSFLSTGRKQRHPYITISNGNITKYVDCIT